MYLGIDLHGKQMTVSARNEAGDVVLRRQVSTRPPKVEEFLEELHAWEDGKYAVLLEVCGFHDWLVKRLKQDPRSVEVVLIQPEQASKKKTDRRDAGRLSELLWLNRHRLLAGERVQGVRQVYEPTEAERQDRQLTSLRERLGRRRSPTESPQHACVTPDRAKLLDGFSAKTAQPSVEAEVPVPLLCSQ